MHVRAVCQFDVRGYKEPTLDELLADRGVRLLMAKDGVDEAALRRLAREVRGRLRSGPERPADAGA
jgi:hypothetical protein